MRQSKQACGLVERLARGIVDRAAKAREGRGAFDTQKLAMPTGHQKDEIRIAQTVSQARGQGMSGQVVDPDQRLAGCCAKPFGHHHTRKYAADQTGSGGDGDRVDLREGHTCLGQGAFDTNVQLFDMGARCDLGHDTAIGRMQRGLISNHRRENLAPAQNGGGRIVTAAFQPKYGDVVAHPSFRCTHEAQQLPPLGAAHNNTGCHGCPTPPAAPHATAGVFRGVLGGIAEAGP